MSSQDSAAVDLIESQHKSMKSSNSKQKPLEMSREENEKEKENRQYVHRALVFSVANVIYRKSGEEHLTFGKVPVNDDKTPPTCIDWSVYKHVELNRDYMNEFNRADILVDGKKTKHKWYKELFSCGNKNVYFFDREKINLTILSQKEEEVDKEENVQDDAVDQWADVDWLSFSEFNLCWRWKGRHSLVFGKVTVTHKNNLREVPTTEIKLVDISEVRLAELVDLPIVVDKNQCQKKWVTYLYEKKSPFFWYFNRHNGTITRTSTRCALRGGFTTRNLAASKGIVVSSIHEFNNAGTSLEYKCFPREIISGDKGCCAPIAAYYICPDLSISVIETLQKDFHEELSIKGNSSILLCDRWHLQGSPSHQPKVVKYFSSASLPGKRGI
jgi:hypothetical protein